jgi:acetyl-CoA synthetase
VYFTGDGARQDADGDFWIMGRIDDVINVSGHRLSTMEVESALVSHPAVSEAAVVGCPDDITGESVYGFVTLKQNHGLTDEATLILSLEQQVDIKISKIARPKHIQVLATLPKTRSGKIMRRVLRALAQGKPLTEDLSTLEDSSFMEQLRRLQEDSAPPVGAV